MIAALVIVSLALTAILAVVVHEERRGRQLLERLERRIAALELDNASTLVVEPEKDPPPPPRRPSQLLN
ncbi:MAG: hypothetical protein ACXVDD_27110 [Polyangia bacterium]